MNGLFGNENGELPSDTKLVSALPSDFTVNGDKPTSDSWVQLEKGQVVAYSLKFGDYTVTKYKDSEAVCEKGDVQENEETRAMRLASEAADAYVKSALTKYASLESEDAKTVVQMTDDGLTKPENLSTAGWIHFNVELSTVSVVDYSLKIGDYVLDYSSLTDGNYVSSITTGSERNKPSIVTVGSTKCYGPEGSQECFKVIKKITENGTQKAILFPNSCLKKYTDNTTNPATITYKQMSSCDMIRFSSSAYWSTSNTLNSDYAKDVNGNAASFSGNPYPYVYNVQGSDTNNVKPYVDGYLTTLKTEIYGLPEGATGRLLSYEEANDSTIFADNAARELSNGDYWLGSAYGSSVLKVVNYKGWIQDKDCATVGLVRPVIIVPTADL